MRERFAEVDDQYDPQTVEERVFAYWEDVDAYRTAKERRADADPFFFVDGPPYTSGAAHMGTTWNKTLKDAYIRYLRMCGWNVTDRPGYDMHGLPIETKVEERLGFENKKDIEAFGMENFIEECREFAEEQLEGLQEDFISFGVWMDWDDPYKTVTPTYMEAAWWGFKRAHERGLVEQGKRSISQCPRCETGLANNEVEYEDVEDPSIYVAFRLADRPGSLVIWTTTPWTLPGNTFVAVDPDLTYLAVRPVTDAGTNDDDGAPLWIAEPCVEEVARKAGYEDYEVVEEAEGAEMVGWRYEHPLAEEVPDHPDGTGALEVHPADYVEADRTGLVHSAPGHGEEDFERGVELGLDPFCPVGADGSYTEAAGEYAGTFVRDANERIIDDLAGKGLLVADETVVHSYGHCWRCDTGIIQIVTDQWFITVTDIKDELLENIEDSEWHPGWARDNRFRDFVENAPDWNVSRQRYWGIPLPIWVPEDADPERLDEDMIVIGDREELAERVDQSIDPDAVDLHRPTVDPLTITEGGTTYRRVPDVFDVWIDSSVATWGTLDFPAETEDFERLWPADLIMEAHDQTRGWFWSQLGMGTAALGESPYRRVLMHGWALDEDGRKMSKSLGNIVEPREAIERHGSDVMRLFLLSVNPQGDDMRFSWDEMETMERTLNILWNVFRFPLAYMRLDGFDPSSTTLEAVEDELTVVDRWVLSRLSTVVETMTGAWEEYRQDRALETLLEFVVEDVSRYYVQLVRGRMWEEEDSPEKRAAYATLYRVLSRVAVLLAPFAPFVAEEIHATLTGDAGPASVHHRDWPEPDRDRVDRRLEADVERLRAVEEAGSNARQQAERKLRWPVDRVVVAAEDERLAGAVERRRDLLAERLNARNIEVLGPGERWAELAYGARVDMSELGPALGERAGAVMAACNEARIDEPTIEALEVAVESRLGEPVDLEPSMVEFVEVPPADVAAAEITLDGEERGVVYVDASLSEDIESEGYAREVIRRVQQMRKELDLDLEAPIRLEFVVDDERVGGLVARHRDLIRREVRASDLGDVEDGHRRTWEVEDVTVRIAIEPADGGAG